MADWLRDILEDAYNEETIEEEGDKLDGAQDSCWCEGYEVLVCEEREHDRRSAALFIASQENVDRPRHGSPTAANVTNHLCGPPGESQARPEYWRMSGTALMGARPLHHIVIELKSRSFPDASTVKRG
jgi:hypothetical protein